MLERQVIDLRRDWEEYRKEYPETTFSTREEAVFALADYKYKKMLEEEERILRKGESHVAHDWTEVLCDDVDLCGDSHHFMYYLCKRCGQRVKDGSKPWRFHPDVTGKFFEDCPGGIQK